MYENALHKYLSKGKNVLSRVVIIIIIYVDLKTHYFPLISVGDKR